MLCLIFVLELLKEGMPFQRIIDDVRTNKADLKRVNLLDKKDLHNIIRDYKISYKIKKHQDNSKISIARIKRKAHQCLNVIEEARDSIMNCKDIEKHLDRAIALVRCTPR